MSRSIALAFISCTLSAGLIFAACGGSQVPVNDPSTAMPSASAPTDLPSAAPAASAVPPVDTSSASTRPTISGDNVAPPLVLNLVGPSPTPAKGEIKLSLDIVTSVKISGPVTLAIKLPTGASLKSGSATESLQISEVGTMTREYVVTTKAALSGPIVVTADNASPTGASGFHAEKQYPAATETGLAGSGMKPPTARPSGPPPGKRP